jgi:hypothetical protein
MNRRRAGDLDVAQHSLAKLGELLTRAAASQPFAQSVEHPLAGIVERLERAVVPEWPRAARRLR